MTLVQELSFHSPFLLSLRFYNIDMSVQNTFLKAIFIVDKLDCQHQTRQIS